MLRQGFSREIVHYAIYICTVFKTLHNTGNCGVIKRTKDLHSPVRRILFLTDGFYGPKLFKFSIKYKQHLSAAAFSYFLYYFVAVIKKHVSEPENYVESRVQMALEIKCYARVICSAK